MTTAGATYPTDDEKMALAIRLARETVRRGAGGPFGAAVFRVGSGRPGPARVKRVRRRQNPGPPARVGAPMPAQQRGGSFPPRAPDQPAHELVTSCEPCAMCL